MKTLIFLAVLLSGLMPAPLASQRLVNGKVSTTAGQPIAGVNVTLKSEGRSTLTNATGNYTIAVPESGGILVFAHIGFVTREITLGKGNTINVVLSLEPAKKSEAEMLLQGKVRGIATMDMAAGGAYDRKENLYQPAPEWNTEEYDGIQENIFHSPLSQPLSTFSIDVDAASYSNVRRFLTMGQMPPVDAVRVEEMINYFDYKYPQPGKEHPFQVYMETASAPWNPNHKLVHIGLQGREIPTAQLPPSNLVFLIDVSGSMEDPRKLPLLKQSFRLLTEQLREQDHVAIVVYAGAAGLVLPPTSGAEKSTIMDALDALSAGGSTAGGAGIRLAYDIAKQHFREGGNNRVILATDGDFNIGESSNSAMEHLIEERRKDGIYLTVLGFGMGNYKDSKMQILADKGNGNHAYIDNLLEAQKVLVHEFGGTLFTIAKDVKLQVEFNPAHVKAYRLIGYENRMLQAEDFNNDKKDAGEMGSGHSVTALYEVIPVGVESTFFQVDPLKYQEKALQTSGHGEELLTVKIRYKAPDQETSKLLSQTLSSRSAKFEEASEDFRWSAAVAAFGMKLRGSPHVADYTYKALLTLAEGAKGADQEGYRAEMIRLARSADLMKAH